MVLEVGLRVLVLDSAFFRCLDQLVSYGSSDHWFDVGNRQLFSNRVTPICMPALAVLILIGWLGYRHLWTRPQAGFCEHAQLGMAINLGFHV